MKLNLRALAVAGVAVPALVFGAAAFAQPASPPQPGQYGLPPSPQQMAGQFRKNLELRPDQESALQDFVRAITPPSDYQRKMYEQQQEMRSMNTPQRLDAMVSQMDDMRQQMLSRVQATKAFYNQLTPEQKRKFDQMGAQGGGQGSGPGGDE
ncbi:MAG TPA: Spy/CpxP family protein refolding chaperone [Caulobacteraceae bacterium]|jgi:Spy/CpxP family protein refolding chaperone